MFIFLVFTLIKFEEAVFFLSYELFSKIYNGWKLINPISLELSPESVQADTQGPGGPGLVFPKLAIDSENVVFLHLPQRQNRSGF